MNKINNNDKTNCPKRANIFSKETFDFCYGGKHYDVYRQNSAPYVLNNIRFCYDSRQQIETLSSQQILYKNDKCKERREIVLELTASNQYTDTDREQPVTLYLYKEGISKPLITVSECACDNEVLVVCDDKWNRLSVGHYFILVDSVVHDDRALPVPENYVLFPFVLLESGEHLQHPLLSGVRMERYSVLHDALGEMGKVALKIDLKALPVSYHQFTACCYNKHWICMGKGDTFWSNKQRKNGLTIRFTSSRRWVEGDYFVILLHNRQPFARIDCTMNREGKIKCTVASDFDVAFYALFMRFFEDKRCYWWHDAQFQPGLSLIRSSFLTQLYDYSLDKLREWHNLPTLLPTPCLLLCGIDRGYNKCIAEILVRSWNVHGTVTHITASSLLEKSCSMMANETFDFSEYTGQILYIDRLFSLFSGNAFGLVGKLVDALNADTFSALVLGGTEREIKQLFELFPELKPFFVAQKHYELSAFTIDDVLYLIEHALELKRITLDAVSWKTCYDYLKVMECTGRLAEWTVENVKDFIAQFVVKAMKQTMCSTVLNEMFEDSRLLEQAAIGPLSVSNAHGEADCNPYLDRLNELTGLSELKGSLKRMFDRMAFDAHRRSFGLVTGKSTAHHMVFTGNPGTGKTTVAKMIGKICRSLGILSNGEVIVTERSQLVGRYIGETERNVLEVLKQAQGNVLFIDEAYNLAGSQSENSNDFGKQVINALLTVMAQDNADMVVIMAGYKEEMDRMLEMNVGLKGRFSHNFHFPDYTAEELLQIGDRYLCECDYFFTPEARKLWNGFVERSFACKDRFFSNARWIKQVIENELIPAMAQRVMQQPASSDKVCYQTIVAEDVQKVIANAVALSKTVVPLRPVIGFRA